VDPALKNRFGRWMVAAATLIFASPNVAAAVAPTAPRQQLLADFDWKFSPGDPSGAEAPGFDDSSWRWVDLPHDWSIEGTPEKRAASGSGGGYYPAGVAWYRKTFEAPEDWKGRRVSLEFDGVYMNATVYLNGHKLATHPYGYTSFQVDLTSDLKFAARNLMAVRVDNSEQPNSRWYSGSGIYRHVRLIVTAPLQVDHWGVFVTTPDVASDRAKVTVRTRLKNDGNSAASLAVRTILIGPAGVPVGEAESPANVAAGADSEVIQQINVSNPALWSPDSPRLYKATTRVVAGGTVTDEMVTPFGIRALAWSAEQGFRLNGKPIKLAGGSVHHDNGPLGAAAFDRAEERKVELLKAAGFNAVRTAHNPPSPAFMDACDRLGLLVLDEPFDVWTIKKVKFDYARFFPEWWRQDIDAMVLRDRNHPSIVIWGIGNEIPDAWTKDGPPLARQIAARVRSLDDTRPLTEAVPGATFTSNIDGVLSNLDIAGYNYNLATNQAEDHRRVPSRLMVTTESLPPSAFENWEIAKEKNYVAGEFVWTAMDYLGESGAGTWSYATPAEAAQIAQFMPLMTTMMSQMGANGENPFAAFSEQTESSGDNLPLPIKVLFPGYPWHAAQCGDLDLTGWRKPQSYYREILWNGGDRVYATVRLPEPEGKKIIAVGWTVYPTVASWSWPGQEGKEMQVEVYSGPEKVRLFLNGKLLGEKPTGRAEQFRTMFSVPYEPGELKAVGIRGDRVVAESVLRTAGQPARLRLTADRSVIQADGEDLSFLTVEAVDGEGRFQPNADQEVQFELSGPGTVAAVGNGDGKDGASYRGDRRRLFQGRALVVVRSSRQSGAIHVRAVTSGLKEATVTIQAEAAARSSERR
jgi:beta-galactosidase